MAIMYTGGAGRVGTVIRAGLEGQDADVRLLVMEPGTELLKGETEFVGDLSNLDLLTELCNGVETIVHLGGIADERSFEMILENNIVGTYNLFEAARRANVRRVVFASSNHATGFYPSDTTIDNEVLPRPDSYYGVSKAFGETLGRLYHDKWGLEVVNLRIGSFRDTPGEARQLSTWLSYRDAISLMQRSIDAPDVGYQIVYGVSANTRAFWENEAGMKALGWQPLDNAEAWADQFAGQAVPGHQGGGYVDPDYTGGLW
ncbi:NAD-dependent epimerase/dehydratase family protein [Arthrobacter sp. NPDC056886]|uniref:NAD-dependent epimerase/dehydratase family protein n=1 Tax=Arthrobacter sp. NPDC056886 TaxID=3345960 RepID=UPI00366E5792